MSETNHELFPGLPIGCSESLDGQHNHLKSDDVRIRHPAMSHKVKSYTRKLGRQRKEIYNGICNCGDVKRMEIILN